jgi:hypothetical protein
VISKSMVRLRAASRTVGEREAEDGLSERFLCRRAVNVPALHSTSRISCCAFSAIFPQPGSFANNENVGLTRKEKVVRRVGES